MVNCQFCNREMNDADSCTKNIILYRTEFEDELSAAGIWYHAIPYGDEDRPSEIPDDVSQPERCHDCGTALGGFHHPGCDWEEDPWTGDQLIKEVMSIEPPYQPQHGRLEPDPHSDIDLQDIPGFQPAPEDDDE